MSSLALSTTNHFWASGHHVILGVVVHRYRRWIGLLVASLLRKLACCLLLPWKLTFKTMMSSLLSCFPVELQLKLTREFPHWQLWALSCYFSFTNYFKLFPHFLYCVLPMPLQWSSFGFFWPCHCFIHTVNLPIAEVWLNVKTLRLKGSLGHVRYICYMSLKHKVESNKHTGNIVGDIF